MSSQITPPISFKVRTTLPAHRIVALDTAGSDFVIAPSAATVAPIGITTDTVSDTTQSIPVLCSGIAKVLFNETMTTGGLVAADSVGRGVPHADVTAGSYVIGRLTGPSITQTGMIADVLINPVFKSIP